MALRLMRRIPPRLRWWVGSGVLTLTAWVCMYGKIWSFEKFEQHRFTSMAMLTGTLRLRSMVMLAGHDEQVFDGAVYTNWGFGVPLLELPFHAFARLVHLANVGQGFFPDRAIYFFYLVATMPVLWMALDYLLALRWTGTSPGRRMAVSWAATWMVLNVILFPFMSTRFVVYEETLSYMTLCQLLALSAFLFARRGWTTRTAVAVGVAAGLGLLVRPIGAVYLGVWGGLVLLEGRRRKLVPFALAAAPFVAFWLLTNVARSGSLLALGYGNSNPAWQYETPLLRFGTTCGDSAWHLAEAAGRLFGAFFFYIWRTPHDPWLKTCHFDFEERDGAREPFFGPAILVLLVGMVYRLVVRRERRLTLLVPYAGLVFLFAAFVHRGEGFAWRYVGDFWPLIVLATLQFVDTLPVESQTPLDARTVKIFFWVGFVALARFLVPWEWSSRADILQPHGDYESAHGSTTLESDFRLARYGVDPALPARVACADRPRAPYHNGFGWMEDCKTASFTNVYLGVTPREDDRYVVRIATAGRTAPTVSLYLNGRVYLAERRGDVYEAEVKIHYADLGSPIVMATVLWTRDESAPTGRLLSIELG